MQMKRGEDGRDLIGIEGNLKGENDVWGITD